MTLATLHVAADAGPSEMTCKWCRNLMLPCCAGPMGSDIDVPPAVAEAAFDAFRPEQSAAVAGGRVSRWTCFLCDRALFVTWGAAA